VSWREGRILPDVAISLQELKVIVDVGTMFYLSWRLPSPTEMNPGLRQKGLAMTQLSCLVLWINCFLI